MRYSLGEGVLGRELGAGFVFSSRRRHTRSTRDWSSDVCSSDLRAGSPLSGRNRERGPTAGVITVAGPSQPDRAGAGPVHRRGPDAFLHATGPKRSRSLKCAPIVTRRANTRCVRSSTPAAAATGPPRSGASRTVSKVPALTALRRVLVADDDATARRLLCILLDLKELGLLEARDGPVALDGARS